MEEKTMKNEILKLLSVNARLSNAELAAVLDTEEGAVASAIAEMEEQGIIKGYKCVVDRDKLSEQSVSAIIELKVTPEAGYGFEDIAKKISLYPQVESVSLMSGACDLIVVVNCPSFREVAAFVANELAVITAVTATATQFIMRRYKEFGVALDDNDDDGRGVLSL